MYGFIIFENYLYIRQPLLEESHQDRRIKPNLTSAPVHFMDGLPHRIDLFVQFSIPCVSLHVLKSSTQLRAEGLPRFTFQLKLLLLKLK